MIEKYVVPSGFKVVAGGQSGADQGGLDWAIAHGVRHGGWCPKGRRSEDGPIDARYALLETAGSGYLERTEWNVRDSDATLIFTLKEMIDGGSKKTAEFADRLGKPWRHIHPRVHPKYIACFLRQHKVSVLNVAGKRESAAPGMAAWVGEMLDQALEVQR